MDGAAASADAKAEGGGDAEAFDGVNGLLTDALAVAGTVCACTFTEFGERPPVEGAVVAFVGFFLKKVKVDFANACTGLIRSYFTPGIGRPAK